MFCHKYLKRDNTNWVCNSSPRTPPPSLPVKQTHFWVGAGHWNYTLHTCRRHLYIHFVNDFTFLSHSNEKGSCRAARVISQITIADRSVQSELRYRRQTTCNINLFSENSSSFNVNQLWLWHNNCMLYLLPKSQCNPKYQIPPRSPSSEFVDIE